MSLTKITLSIVLLLLMLTVGCSKAITKAEKMNNTESYEHSEIEQGSKDTVITPAQRQLELLQEAFAPQTPKEAADKWANGVKTRNGAAQFAVLSPELKEKLLSKYKEIMWVTGTSSPWVKQYIILNEQKETEEVRKYEIQFELATSTGTAGNYTIEVSIKKYSNKWYITQITSPIGGLFPQ